MTYALSIAARCAKSLIQSLFAAVTIALIAGCASAPRPLVPVPLVISVMADPKVNPDLRGRPSPVKVVIYELKSSSAFESADFFSLSQKDQASIGGELLGREEIFLRPGESRTLVRKGYADTAVIGVFAEFRDIDKSVWRATSVIPAAETAGMFSSLRGGPKERPYQVLLEQGSVKIMALADTYTISGPKLALPSVSMPSIAMPSVSPAITMPSVSMPSIAMPSITMPSVTMPSITMPSVDGISQGGVPGFTGPVVVLPTVEGLTMRTTSSSDVAEGVLPSLPTDAAPAGDGLGALKGMAR